MKWLIASDIHGSAYYCRRLFQRFESEGAERILLLGDLLYHGPRNDLPRDYDTRETAKILNSYADVIAAVRGNCDTEVDQMVLDFPVLADYALLDLGASLVFATHGHTHSPQNLPRLAKGGVLLSGHTHVPMCKTVNNVLCLNPGSVSIPKEASPNSYMTFENGVFTWKDIEGAEYMRYPDTQA